MVQASSGELLNCVSGDIDLTPWRNQGPARCSTSRRREPPLVGNPKGSGQARDVAIPPHLLPEFERHLNAHVPPANLSPVYGRDSGEQLASSTLYRWFYPAREAAGRPDLRWHDLRHTGAVLAAATGATLAELMNRLGHSTVGAAMRYQHAAQIATPRLPGVLSAMVEQQ